MQAERWPRIEEIVQSAIDSPPENRQALLDAACADDVELRREVESLLAVHESGGFTASVGLADAIKVLEQRNAQLDPSRTIGAYRILREIGRGGMGAVYLAARADETFQKLVAIKITRRGLDAEDIIRRFRGERQILAMLDHPHIARLLDGGSTDDGLPYFVMEYIEGEPIDRYCDRHRLTVAARLKLFQGVCEAVSYAHRNLVIHRDIKPGNVLVTTEGVPRLLDFGIAKLLAPSTMTGQTTLTALQPFTPEYASPEQVRGEPVSTASDVYSLGVLLYLLLTSHAPYRRTTSVVEIERVICEEEPEKPSVAVMRRATPAGEDRTPEASQGRLSRQLRGDVDNIVLKALRKEPARRYTSAEQLSEDIGRHLAGLPVAARADTRGYRTAKFLRRNRAWVAAGGLVFLVLTGGICVSLWQAREVRKQRDVARLEQVKAARINAFLQEMIGYSGVAGGTPKHSHDATVADMLDDAAQRVETELADQPEVKAEMLGTIAGTYLTQSKLDRAARYSNEAYALNVKLYGTDGRQTAAAMQGLGVLAYLTGDYLTAESWFRKALPIYRRHANDPDFEIRLLVAMLSDAAFVQRALGKPGDAEALWREALTYGPRLPARNHGQSISPKTFLAQLYLDRGDIAKADVLASEASRDLRAFGSDRFLLAQSLIDLGDVRSLEGRYAEADASIEEGTRLYAQAQGDGHPNVAYGLLRLAESHYRQAKYSLAEQDTRKALAIVEKLPDDPRRIGAADISLGLIFVKTGRLREAEPLLRKALTIGEKKSPRRSKYMATALGGLGECLGAQKRYVEAELLLTESYEILGSLQVPQSPALRGARDRLALLHATREGAPEAVPK